MEVTLHRSGKYSISEKASFLNHCDTHLSKPNRLGALCLLNETEIEPLGSCEVNPHCDIGIVTIVTHGLLEHKDTDGSRGVIKAGQIQYITAGDNLRLLEHNPSAIEKTKLLQLWIIPRKKGFMTRYEQRNCDMDRFNRWALIISGNGRKNSLRVEQDVTIRVSHLFMGHTLVSDPTQVGYGRLLFVLDGEVNACGHTLRGRDELHVIGDEAFEITANRDAHLFLIDVPMSDFE
ncbi:MAG: pirin family protein [Sulfuricurvum sp.]|uniref:pirin family protein n=1 Tax=Sulfuricurvum sp. TaxID=2025608 RepID=UPI0025F2A757|nr:pirin family protein [Sulfuricurvum sp.]MBV5320971.1 pirin family protein [Sulfuricurvum sp.]